MRAYASISSWSEQVLPLCFEQPVFDMASSYTNPMAQPMSRTQISQSDDVATGTELLERGRNVKLRDLVRSLVQARIPAAPYGVRAFAWAWALP